MDAEAESTRWVFIRGLVRESAHWDDFPDRFMAQIPGARVERVDLPGNGCHHRLTSPWSLDSVVEFVRADLLRRRGTGSAFTFPVHLFSISLGSMVAVEWMDRYPREVAGAVLVNTSLRKISPFHQRLHWRAWPEMFRIAREPDVAARERGILHLTAALKTPSDIDALVRSRVQIHRRHPVQAMNVLRQIIAAARFAPPKARPPIPILLLSSRGDRLADPRCTEALAAAWSLEPRCHPTAGHDLPLDDPDWTIQQVLEWLRDRSVGHRSDPGQTAVNAPDAN